MTCEECSGSGACDACDGYGTYPPTDPMRDDGPECDVCSGDGLCVACYGATE